VAAVVELNTAVVEEQVVTDLEQWTYHLEIIQLQLVLEVLDHLMEEVLADQMVLMVVIALLVL
jgi:hypothetical protein